MKRVNFLLGAAVVALCLGWLASHSDALAAGAPTVVATVPLPGEPRFMGVNQVTHRVYVATGDAFNSATHKVAVIDGTSLLTSIAQPDASTGPIFVTTNDLTNRVYVTHTGAGNASAINGATNAVIGAIPSGAYPESVVVNPAANRAYIANTNSGTISVINTTGDVNSLVTNIPVPGTGAGVTNLYLAIMPTANRLFVTAAGLNKIFIIDTTTNTVISSAPVPGGPRQIVADASANRLWVTNGAGIRVLDASTLATLATVPVGSTDAHGLALNANQKRLYVTNSSSPTLTVIDLTTNTVSASVNLGTNLMFPGADAINGRVYVGTTAKTLVILDDSPAVADLSITQTGPASANLSTEFDYILTLSNSGPATASGVTVNDALPSTVQFVNSPAGCTHDGSSAGGLATCQVASVAPGANIVLGIHVRAIAPGAVPSNASITFFGNVTDTNATNNQASFTTTINAPTFPVTVSRTGTGQGTVTSTPAGIDCGSSCTATFDSGAVVTLTATPDATSTFAGWTGACSGTGPCVLSIDAAKTVSATFTRSGNTPTGAGVVVVIPTPGGPVVLTFSSVIGAGDTTATTSPTGPAVPVGFVGASPYVNLNTSAGYAGTITVCLPAPPPGPRTTDRLLHYTGSAWVDITSPVPPVAGSGVICGLTNSLSPFVIVSPVTAPPVVAHASLDRLGEHVGDDDRDEPDDERESRGRTGRYRVGASCEFGTLTSATLNGVAVVDGQIVLLKFNDNGRKQGDSRTRQRTLVVRAASFELVVTCTGSQTVDTDTVRIARDGRRSEDHDRRDRDRDSGDGRGRSRDDVRDRSESNNRDRR